MTRPYQPPTTIAATLTTAARYIEQFGWHSGYLYDNHTGCARCACHRTGYYPASIIGAIRAALTGRPKWFMDTTPPGTTEAYAACLDHLNHHLTAYGAAGTRAPALIWQSTPVRTPAQVIAALRAAASTAPPGRLYEPTALAPVIDLATRRRTAAPPALFDPSTPAA